MLRSMPDGNRTVALEIQLLGGFELRLSGGAPISLATRKAEALVALLAVRPGEIAARDKLCGLLWPDVQDSQARHSLRQTLLCLRKALASSPGPVLQSDARRVSLDPMHVRVDVARVEQAITIGTRESLGEAAALWRGEFLEGAAIGEAPFQQWLTFERERLRRVMIQALTRLTDLHVAAEDTSAAIQACAQLLQLDPWREEAHRTLMRLHVRQGRRGSAVQHYHNLVRSLRAELHSEPEEQTRALFAELERADSATSTDAQRVLLRDPGIEALAIGRRVEVASLQAALSWSGDRQTKVTLLTGEAGVGKTHTCDRVAAEAAKAGVRVLRARAFESELVLPFSVWANLLAGARVQDDSTLMGGLPPELLAELSSLVPELASGTERRRTTEVLQLFRAVEALVERLATPAPLLLILDDLQWADEMSLRLLCYLSRRSTTVQRINVLGVARHEELASAPFLIAALGELERERVVERMELTPLTREESRDLALQLAERLRLGTPSPAWLERVWSISEGNPLAIVESARASVQGALAQDIATMPIPERVRALIQRRMRGLSATAAELLSFAAVAGRELELGLLQQRGADPEQLLGMLEELINAQLVRARGDRYYFTHDRVRETVYEGLLPARRRWLHGQVAMALERFRAAQLDSVLGHIGYHYSKAGNAERAVDFLVRFAERAVRGHGVGEALAALEQAAADCAQLPPTERTRAAIDIATHQAFCLAWLGRFAELNHRLMAQAAAVEALDEPRLAAPFYFWLGYSFTLTGARVDAEKHARRALVEATRGNDTQLIAYAHSLLSYVCAATARSDEGLVHGETATRLLTIGDNRPEAIVLAWVSFGLNKMIVGDWRGALAASQRAREIANTVDSDRCRSLADSVMSYIFAYTERWERALERAQASLTNAKEPFTLVVALLMVGLSKTGLDQTAESIVVLEHLITQLDKHGMRSFGAHARHILAMSHLRRGELEEAVRANDEALAIANETGDFGFRVATLRTNGRTAIARGDLGTARDSLNEAMRFCDQYGLKIEMAHTREVCAELAFAASDQELARRELEHARALFAECSVEAATKRVRARLAQI